MILFPKEEEEQVDFTTMATPHSQKLAEFFLFLFLLCSLIRSYSSRDFQSVLRPGSALSVEEKTDVLTSPNGDFTAGFYSVGENAFCIAIWFTRSIDSTVVWMANRDQPVNGKSSSLRLQTDGNLVIIDSGQFSVWKTNTTSVSQVILRLLNTGNLVLQTSSEITLWQSFDFPTDTLLPQQSLTQNSRLVSARSHVNPNSGFYSFYFDNDNVLRLLFSGRQTSSVYWPDPASETWKLGRTTYNNTRIAALDDSGVFRSSDEFKFFAADFGVGTKRRLTLDFDGNLRLYSLNDDDGTWFVSWQAMSQSCRIHGLCGPNGICINTPERSCACPPGFSIKDSSDWSQGCEPSFSLSCDPQESKFIVLPQVDFYGYDFNYSNKITQQDCENICLQLCSCKAFIYAPDGNGTCFPKTSLHNGYMSPSYWGTMHVKVPKTAEFLNGEYQIGKQLKLQCSVDGTEESQYEIKQEDSALRKLLWFVMAMAGVEIICIVLGWWYLYRKQGYSLVVDQGYLLTAVGFRRYSYRELKIATKNFSEEIGRGGAGIVYKAVLSDGRVAAVKRLEGVKQEEEEFLAEVNTIGRIYHKNLIQTWGFCAEGKNNRLLVYEFMVNGSLAENLSSQSLDWEKRFEIAVGMARGLSYLHEECLEWVLHCDVKPHNILLDEKFQPKLADFGLSKLLNRGGVNNSSFSRVRGTRGYMAPEWILNLPITSKVDVYSYGIVVMEMLTGKSSTELTSTEERGGNEFYRLVRWLREKMDSITIPTLIEQVIDSRIEGGYEALKMESLLKVALKCVEEDRNARPTMSHVVEMLLLHPENFPLEQ